MANLSNINNKFLVTTGGNVGINVTSPGAKLDVDGDVYVRNGHALYLDTLAGYSSAVVSLNASTNFIVPSGSVGIGTDSPDYNLEIENASSPTIATKDTTNNVITKMFSANSQGFIGTESNHDLRVRTNNTDKITIQSGGNVGIGTIGPSANLDILNGTTGASLKLSATATAYWQLQRDSTTGNLNISDDALGNVMSFDQLTGNVGIGTASPSSPLHVDAAPANGVYLSYLYNSATHNSANGLNVQTSSNNILTYGLRVNTAGDSNALAVMGNGSVGIGTASPGSRLEVYGTDGSRNHFNEGLRVTRETVPAQFGMVNFNGGALNMIAVNTAGTGSVTKFMRSGNGTSLDTSMVIDNDGNVGIGITGPTSKLHSVITTAGDSALKLQDDTGSVFDFQCGIAGVTGDALVIKDTTLSYDYLTLRSGNVGIGETSPAHKLSIKATDDTRGILVNNTLTTSYAEVALKASREFRMGTGGSASATDARDRWYVYDATAATHRLTLDSSGNFGIGTTSPAAATKLDVAGGTKSTFYTSDGGRGFKQDSVAFVSTYSNGADANGVNDIGSTTNKWRDGFFSGGVYLGGTAAANKLDDYEEGTFTPVLTRSSGGAISATYTTQEGNYIKIGNMVYIQILVNISAIASQGSGYVILTGLPFSSLQFAYTQISNVSSNIFGSTNIQKSFTSSQSMYFGEASITNFPPIQTAYSVGLLRVCGTYRV